MKNFIQEFFHVVLDKFEKFFFKMVENFIENLDYTSAGFIDNFYERSYADQFRRHAYDISEKLSANDMNKMMLSSIEILLAKTSMAASVCDKADLENRENLYSFLFKEIHVQIDFKSLSSEMENFTKLVKILRSISAKTTSFFQLDVFALLLSKLNLKDGLKGEQFAELVDVVGSLNLKFEPNYFNLFYNSPTDYRQSQTFRSLCYAIEHALFEQFDDENFKKIFAIYSTILRVNYFF